MTGQKMEKKNEHGAYAAQKTFISRSDMYFAFCLLHPLIFLMHVRNVAR
jgi:hypothetical protein